MISGMAIGSLLVSYLEPHGVFLVSGAIGLAASAYCVLLIPSAAANSDVQPASAAHFEIVNGLKHVLRNGDFLKTMFCIGVPAKAILTGTITFALPLLLGQHGYRSEDIGQIVVLFAMSVVVASSLISRLVDQIGNTTTVLFLGAAISGAGLVLLGLMGSPLVGDGIAGSAIVILGVVLVGIAHGFINAPVVTHVAHSELAKELGANSVTTTYRFVESATWPDGFSSSIVPHLGTNRASPHRDRNRHCDLGFLVPHANFSSPRRGPSAGAAQ